MVFRVADAREWTSAILPRYQRRMPEVNEAIVAAYLAGGNTRRIRGAVQPLLKAAPLSKSAVSRVIAALTHGLEAWRTRSLADLDLIYVYLDGFALRVRSAGKVVRVEASLREGGEELLTSFTFPKPQWRTLGTTNTIERLHEEFRRRVVTQGSQPSEDAAVVLLFSLVASERIRLRRIDGG